MVAFEFRVHSLSAFATRLAIAVVCGCDIQYHFRLFMDVFKYSWKAVSVLYTSQPNDLTRSAFHDVGKGTLPHRANTKVQKASSKISIIKASY